MSKNDAFDYMMNDFKSMKENHDHELCGLHGE